MFAKWVGEDNRFGFSLDDNGGVEITEELYAELFNGQSNGKRIIKGDGGLPELIQPVLSQEDKIESIRSAVTSMLNAKAAEKNYDSIITAALRAGYPGPFHDEGVAYASWMDECWSACYQILAEYMEGTRPEPTAEDLISSLPSLNLP